MRLLLFMGPPAAGKSSIIRKLLPRLGPRVMHIPTDGLRAMLAKPRYTPAEHAMIFAGLFAIARLALQQNYTVVLDAVFRSPGLRQKARRLARQHGAAFTLVHVTAPLAHTLRRNRLREGFARIPEAAVRVIWRKLNQEHDRGEIAIDTSKLSPEQAVRLVLSRMRRR
jgi:predicted kinase